MHDAFYNQMKSTIYLVMDYVQGQSLKQIFEDKNDHSKTCLSINQIKNIFMQMLQAIEYLQSDEVAICHRDLNPNNIMIERLENGSDDPDQYQYKLTLIDFNVAKRFVD